MLVIRFLIHSSVFLPLRVRKSKNATHYRSDFDLFSADSGARHSIDISLSSDADDLAVKEFLRRFLLHVVPPGHRARPPLKTPAAG